jgi:hypothetical protein
MDSYLWTNALGTGAWLAAGNWRNTRTGGSGIPGSGDYAMIGGIGSTMAGCTLAASTSVDRVIMDSTYTGTLTIASGATLTLNTEFQQYGGLALAGTGTVACRGNIYINGTVATAAGGVGTATLETTSSFFVSQTATITASTFGSGGSGLLLEAGAFDDSGTLNVGTAAAPSNLTIAGNFVQEPNATTTVFGASGLTFLTGGNNAALADIKGTLNVLGTGGTNASVTNNDEVLIDGGTLQSTGGSGTSGNIITGNVGVENAGRMTVGAAGVASSLLTVSGTLTVGTSSPSLAGGTGTLTLAAGATLANANTLFVDGGTLSSTGGTAPGNTITGNVSVYNGGSMSVGTGTAASTLNLTGGSLTVGASAPGGSATGGTLNLNTGATLNFPAASGSSTFQVQGTLSNPGVVNMDGATIGMAAGRVAFLDLEGGTLNTFGSSSGGDTIAGSLNNAGTVDFAGGALHRLSVSGTYTETSAGMLKIRLNNGSGGIGVSDVLAIGGAASLDGTLELTAQANLTPRQSWTPVTYASEVGDFDTVVFPNDGNPLWDEQTLATIVAVTN